MRENRALIAIKVVHTLIWYFFNVVIFYMLYAVIMDRIGILFWTGLGLVALEGLTLLVFRYVCPLTLVARKYSESTRDNFDIYLPIWLARNTKRIYTSIMVLILVLATIRLLT